MHTITLLNKRHHETKSIKQALTIYLKRIYSENLFVTKCFSYRNNSNITKDYRSGGRTNGIMFFIILIGYESISSRQTTYQDIMFFFYQIRNINPFLK